MQRSAHGEEVEAIALYPLGIQMGTLAVEEATTAVSTHASSSAKFIPREFWSRETIVDCVVTELVYSYKVQSAVMLRTIRTTDDITNTEAYSRLKMDVVSSTSKDDNMTDLLNQKHKERKRANGLIRLYSDVEMTYMECLIIRSQINKYLNHYVKATKDADEILHASDNKEASIR
jgi:hypothetical protein